MPFVAGQLLKASQLNANMPQLLGSTVLSAPQTSITLTVPAGFNHIEAIFTARKDAGGGGGFCWMRFNGDTGNNYQWVNQISNNATGTSGASLVNYMQMGLCAGLSDTANYFATGHFTVGNISSTTATKPLESASSLVCNTTTYYKASFGGIWNSTAAITSITLLPDAGNLVAGSSLSIYGWG